MLVLEWKERAFIEKVNSRCFCWFPAAILVHQNGAPIWRLHTKLYKGAWNVSANNSETVGHKDLRLGQIVYILVFYNISFSWLLPLDGFQFFSLLRDSVNDLLGGFFESRTSTGSETFSILIVPWRCQICLATYLYFYRDDLPENLDKTAEECKKPTSGQLLSLKIAFA